MAANTRSLANAAYTDDAFARLENKRLFPRTWVAVACAHELESAGDILPVTVAGRSIILVRNGEGAINGFYNSCRHRGNELISKPCRRRESIRCPYHSWSYDLDGRLTATPHFSGFGKNFVDGRDMSELGLRPARCARWMDVLFVNLDESAPPLEQYMHPFSEQFKDYPLEVLRYGGQLEYEVAANWKLFIENFVEALHVATVHPRYNEVAPFQDYRLVIDGPCFGANIMVGYPEPDGVSLPRFSNLPEGYERGTKNLVLFPNFTFVAGPDSAVVTIVYPRGTDRLIWRLDFYFVDDGATDPAFEEARNAYIGYIDKTVHQDTTILESWQRGKATAAFDNDIFSPAHEDAVRHFQGLVIDHVT